MSDPSLPPGPDRPTVTAGPHSSPEGGVGGCVDAGERRAASTGFPGHPPVAQTPAASAGPLSPWVRPKNKMEGEKKKNPGQIKCQLSNNPARPPPDPIRLRCPRPARGGLPRLSGGRPSCSRAPVAGQSINGGIERAGPFPAVDDRSLDTEYTLRPSSRWMLLLSPSPRKSKRKQYCEGNKWR